MSWLKLFYYVFYYVLEAKFNNNYDVLVEANFTMPFIMC